MCIRDSQYTAPPKPIGDTPLELWFLQKNGEQVYKEELESDIMQLPVEEETNDILKTMVEEIINVKVFSDFVFGNLQSLQEATNIDISPEDGLQYKIIYETDLNETDYRFSSTSPLKGGLKLTFNPKPGQDVGLGDLLGIDEPPPEGFTVTVNFLLCAPMLARYVEISWEKPKYGNLCKKLIDIFLGACSTIIRQIHQQLRNILREDAGEEEDAARESKIRALGTLHKHIRCGTEALIQPFPFNSSGIGDTHFPERVFSSLQLFFADRNDEIVEKSKTKTKTRTKTGILAFGLDDLTRFRVEGTGLDVLSPAMSEDLSTIFSDTVFVNSFNGYFDDKLANNGDGGPKDIVLSTEAQRDYVRGIPFINDDMAKAFLQKLNEYEARRGLPNPGFYVARAGTLFFCSLNENGQFECLKQGKFIRYANGTDWVDQIVASRIQENVMAKRLTDFEDLWETGNNEWPNETIKVLEVSSLQNDKSWEWFFRNANGLPDPETLKTFLETVCLLKIFKQTDATSGTSMERYYYYADQESLAHLKRMGYEISLRDLTSRSESDYGPKPYEEFAETFVTSDLSLETILEGILEDIIKVVANFPRVCVADGDGSRRFQLNDLIRTSDKITFTQDGCHEMGGSPLVV